MIDKDALINGIYCDNPKDVIMYICDFEEVATSEDTISRQAIMKEFADFVRESNNSDFAQTPTWNDAVSLVGSMPSAQPDTDEWCHDCAEYDREKHCCPRFNRVIRETLNEVVSQIKWERDVAVQQLKDLGYSLGEKPRMGHWINEGIYGEGHSMCSIRCSECDWHYIGYLGDYDFCPHCGTKMEMKEK